MRSVKEFRPNIFPRGTQLYYPGYADDPVNGVGEGDAFEWIDTINIGSPNSTTKRFSFNDVIWLAGGTVSWSGGGASATDLDRITIMLEAPASPITPNGSGTGNCFVGDGSTTPPGYPGPLPAGLIVPAAANGTHDVDLSNATPLPAGDYSSDPSGFWDYTNPDKGYGTISASAAPGAASWHLYAAAVPLARYIKGAKLLNSGQRAFTESAMEVKPILPQWEIVVTIEHNSVGTLIVGWELLCSRKRTI